MLYKHCVGSFARVLSFMQAAALGSMGSFLPIAALCINVGIGLLCLKQKINRHPPA